jgi:hypothetical protein
MSKQPLTWNELAELYDKVHSGRKARTLPMEKVFEWAEQQPKRFRVGKDDCLYLAAQEKL